MTDTALHVIEGRDRAAPCGAGAVEDASPGHEGAGGEKRRRGDHGPADEVCEGEEVV